MPPFPLVFALTLTDQIENDGCRGWEKWPHTFLEGAEMPSLPQTVSASFSLPQTELSELGKGKGPKTSYLFSSLSRLPHWPRIPRKSRFSLANGTRRVLDW